MDSQPVIDASENREARYRQGTGMPFAMMVAFLILINCGYEGRCIAAVVPVIITTQLASYEPTVNGQAIGTIMAKGEPTSWRITSCTGCEDYFALDSSGKLSVTQLGAAAISSTTLPAATFTATVAATSPAGSAKSPITLTFYPDGTFGAPRVSVGPQFPSQLDVYHPSGGTSGRNRYNGFQPPWNVAGVDYAVGPASETEYVPWTSFSHPGCSVGKNFLRCSSSCENIVVDSVDFTVKGGAQLILDSSCTNFSVSNCKWAGSNLSQVSTGVIDTAASGTIKYNDIDGGSVGGIEAQSLLIFNRSGENLTIQYNYLHNAANEIVAGAGHLDYRFNLISDVNIEAGGHMNILQWDSGVADHPLFAFNTLRQTRLGGAEGPQFYFNRAGTMVSPVVANNTLLALGGRVMSYIIHGSVSPSTVLEGDALLQDNYIDASGAYGALYPGSFIGWKISHNVDLRTGAFYSAKPK